MHSLKRYWETSTFRKKLITVFMPLALIPMISLTLLSSWIYSNQIKQTMDHNVINTLNLVNNHLNTYLNELTRLSVLPYYNDQILAIMQQKGGISQFEYTQIQALLSQAIRNPREDLQSVFIYRRDGQIFSSSTYDADINYQYPFERSSWYRKAIAANGRVVFTGEGNDLRIFNRPQSAFSVARAIKIYNGPVLGVLIIDVNFKGLESIFENVDLGEESNIVILNENNRLIYSKNNNFLDALTALNLSTTRTNRDTRAENDRLVFHVIDSDKTGWNIVGIVSKSAINQKKNIVYKSILMVSAVIWLFVVIASILLSSTITKPLTALRKLMRRVENGDFNVSYQSLKGNVEISLVGRAFNEMKNRINDLIDQVIEIRIKHKEAEIHNLKLQIRPHFLYNNLEAIRALAEIGDRKGIVEMTSALGGMLRYTLNKQNTIVQIRDEIRQIEHYLKIEQIRSGHRLHVVWNLDRKLMRCYTIPILLQPVVENCFHHGFAQRTGPMEIGIHVGPDGGDILLEVRDNGAGMSEADLEKLKAYVAGEAPDLAFGNNGIGLKNLHARIRLEYGAPYGVYLFGKHGQGMTVQIRIPRMDNKPAKMMGERKSEDNGKFTDR